MKLVARGFFREILIFDSDFSSVDNGENCLQTMMSNLKLGVGKTGLGRGCETILLKVRNLSLPVEIHLVAVRLGYVREDLQRIGKKNEPE